MRVANTVDFNLNILNVGSYSYFVAAELFRERKLIL